MPIRCICGKLVPSQLYTSLLRITPGILCKQCLQTQKLIGAINTLALNSENNISRCSINGGFSTHWNGNTLLPGVPIYVDKIIASGTSVRGITPMYTSSDGVADYTPIDFQATETSKIVFNGKLYVTSVKHSNISRLVYSSDGISWVESGISLEDTIEDIASDGFSWLAIARNAGALSSSDGKSWYPIHDTMNTYLDSYFSNCVWAGTMWLVSGCHRQQNCIYSSIDKITWTLLAHIPSQTTFMKYNGKILLIGYKSAPFIQYSLNNGINLLNSLSATFIFPSGCNNVAWNGKLWIGVSPGINTIASSTDGIIWKGLGNSIFTETGNSVCWNTEYWIAGGSGKNSLAYSINGIDWIGLGTNTFTKVTSLCSIFINN
jgi:hypothetical protein